MIALAMLPKVNQIRVISDWAENESQKITENALPTPTAGHTNKPPLDNFVMFSL